MRKLIIISALVVLALGGCQFGDELIAFVSGSPVRLLSATDSLDAFNANKEPLQELFQAYMHEGDLRLIVRTTFYTSFSLTRPYLTVDDEHHGVIHINTKTHILAFSTKCEFLRQFEIELTPTQWKNLKTLEVFNHDTEQSVTPIIQLSNPEYMTKLLHRTNEQLALLDLTGVAGGC